MADNNYTPLPGTHPGVAAYMSARTKRSQGCWEWTGQHHKTGYGLATTHGGLRGLAHRVAWTVFVGPIPEGLFVCHRCDNPPCVRIDHLFLGTHADNMHDAKVKGRMASGAKSGAWTHPERLPRGTRNKMSKITEDDVRKVLTSDLPGNVLAAQLGITPPRISDIRSGKAWVHVERPAKPQQWRRPPASSVDLTGQTFSRLRVEERAGSDKYSLAVWKCRCSCGNITYPTTSRLRSGKTKSCGCLRIDRLVNENSWNLRHTACAKE